MIEIDLREAGRGCIDNPVAVLSTYLNGKNDVRILLKKEQEDLVKEILEIARYTVLEREEEGGTVRLLAAPAHVDR